MKYTVLAILAFTAAFFYPTLSAYAETTQEMLDKKAQEIRELETKLSSLQTQSKTLNNQIEISNQQISVTRLKISHTQEQIALLSDKIQNLEVSLDHVSQILEKRISQTYMQSQTDSLGLIFKSPSFQNLVLQYKYIKSAQAHDRRLLQQVAQTQLNFQTQKDEEINLKADLETQKQLLSIQVSQKQKLLEVTKNDEKRYQSLLTAAKAEQEAIRSAIKSLQLSNGSPIAKGEVIALIGNTGAPGCSSGAHLHLEILKNDVAQNPSQYLQNTSVVWDNSPDAPFSFTGNWEFPIESPHITQGFGMTYWAKNGWYGGAPHTGLDMTSPSLSIRSPQSGTLYRGSTTCKGSVMNYVAVDHGQGVVSWYWHVR